MCALVIKMLKSRNLLLHGAQNAKLAFALANATEFIIHVRIFEALFRQKAASEIKTSFTNSIVGKHPINIFVL